MPWNYENHYIFHTKPLYGKMTIPTVLIGFRRQYLASPFLIKCIISWYSQFFEGLSSFDPRGRNKYCAGMKKRQIFHIFPNVHFWFWQLLSFSIMQWANYSIILRHLKVIIRVFFKNLNWIRFIIRQKFQFLRDYSLLPLQMKIALCYEFCNKNMKIWEFENFC